MAVPFRATHTTTRGPKGAANARVDYMIAEGGYEESYTQHSGHSQVLTVYVPWKQAQNFLEAVLPDVEVLTDSPQTGAPAGVWRLKRYLPQRHPQKNWLFAHNARVKRGVGVTRTGTEGRLVDFREHTGLDGLAEIDVEFRALPYDATVPDTDTSNTGAWQSSERELLRYVSRSSTPGSEAVRVLSHPYRFNQSDVGANTQVGTEMPAYPLPFNDLRYTFHCWPTAGLPAALLGTTRPFPNFPLNFGVQPNPVGFLGRLNGSNFDLNSLAGDYLAPGTALFVAAEVSDPYWTITGTEVRDFTLTFQHRQSTWYKILRSSDGQFLEITRASEEAGIEGLSEFTHIAPGDALGSPNRQNLPNGEIMYSRVTGRSRHIHNYCSFNSLMRPGPAVVPDPGAAS